MCIIICEELIMNLIRGILKSITKLRVRVENYISFLDKNKRINKMGFNF